MKISDTSIRSSHKRCWHLTHFFDSLQLSLWRKLLTKRILDEIGFEETVSAHVHWGLDGPIISLLTSLLETAKNPLLMLSCGLWTPSEGRELHDNSESEAEVCITMETVKPLKCCRLFTLKKLLLAEIHSMQSLNEESINVNNLMTVFTSSFFQAICA